MSSTWPALQVDLDQNAPSCIWRSSSGKEGHLQSAVIERVAELNNVFSKQLVIRQAG